MQTIYPSADVYAWASRIYGPNKRLMITDYVIPCDLGTVAVGASTSKQVQIQANADFVLTRLSYAFEGDAAGAKIQLTDSATGEQFGNSNIALDIFAEYTGAQCYSELPYPRWIGGNTALNVFLETSSGAASPTAYNVNLHGFLVREY